jgi:hypothetical protein
VEYPIEFIRYIAVQLGAHQPLLRGKHIVVLGVTGAGGIKKPPFTLAHGRKYIPWS